MNKHYYCKHGKSKGEKGTIQTSGRSEHHRKLNVLIVAEIRDHKLAGKTLLLA